MENYKYISVIIQSTKLKLRWIYWIHCHFVTANNEKEDEKGNLYGLKKE